MTTGKNIALTRQTFVDKVMSLLFNMLPRLVITFLPRSKCLLISNSMVAVTICSAFEGPKNKVSHCFHCFPIYLPWSDGARCHYHSFLNVELWANFFTLLFHFHQEALSSALLSAIRGCHLHIWGYWYFSWQSWFQLVIHLVWHFTCSLHIS